MQGHDDSGTQALASTAETTHATIPTSDPVTASSDEPEQESSPTRQESSQTKQESSQIKQENSQTKQESSQIKQENSPTKVDNSQPEDTTATASDILGQLVSKRNKLEQAYVDVAMEEYGMEQARALANIEKARSAPQKAKQLQAIHEAHKAVLEFEQATNTGAEGQCWVLDFFFRYIY